VESRLPEGLDIEVIALLSAHKFDVFIAEFPKIAVGRDQVLTN
jgi:hypothetical protein